MSLKLFYCYAREDKLLREALEVYLGNLKRQGLIVAWHDSNINAGQLWIKEINDNLNEADIILLLISPDFVHSDYCYSIEMKRALQRHENGTARVIPIILRQGDYAGAPFSKLQALPADDTSVTDRKWRNRDEAFTNVVQGIRKIVEELHCNKWISKGNEHLFREQCKEALDAFEQAIYFNPDDGLAYVGKGQALLSMSNSEEALAAFTRAIELCPSNADAYVGKGTALYYDELGDINKDLILDTYADAILIDPRNEAAYIARGNALMYYKDFEEALESYEQAIRVTVIPNRDVRKRKGDALFHLGRYEEAIEVYDLCVKAGLKDEDIYINIARTLFNIGNFEKAIDAYEQALTLNANKGQTYLEIGDTYYQLKNYEKAIDGYEQAIKFTPKNENSLLAQAYRGKGNVWQLLSQKSFEKADELDLFGDHPF